MHVVHRVHGVLFLTATRSHQHKHNQRDDRATTHAAAHNQRQHQRCQSVTFHRTLITQIQWIVIQFFDGQLDGKRNFKISQKIFKKKISIIIITVFTPNVEAPIGENLKNLNPSLVSILINKKIEIFQVFRK